MPRLIDADALETKAKTIYMEFDNVAVPTRVIPISELHMAPAVEHVVTGETSDGYHTFNELYHHRAVLFSVIVKAFPEKAWKSRQHSDGSMFEGMFIVGIDTPDGPATYHYHLDPYWDMFACKEIERAPEWDGHTAADAIERIGKLEPVRHGRWIPEKVCSVETKFKCSECNRKIIACNDYFGRAPEWVSNIYPYCHCGAKMRGDEDATE